MSDENVEVLPDDLIRIESIMVGEDNGDEVANFVGASTYTKIRSRKYNHINHSLNKEFTTDGYMMSIPNKPAEMIQIGRQLIRPILDFRDVQFVEPVDE